MLRSDVGRGGERSREGEREVERSRERSRGREREIGTHTHTHTHTHARTLLDSWVKGKNGHDQREHDVDRKRCLAQRAVIVLCLVPQTNKYRQTNKQDKETMRKPVET